MKTKLSLLALPFCLGLVLTFAIAACSGGGDEPSGGNSSNSNGGGGTSYSRPPDVDNDKVKFSDNFDVYVEGNFVLMNGSVDGSAKDHIVKLEFLTNNAAQGWVTYNGSPVDGPVPGIDITTVSLRRAQIDLTNDAIPCGTHSLTIKACTQTDCAQKSKDFEKPKSLCPDLNSSASEPSSSSEAVWVFGSPHEGDFEYNKSLSIGSGSIKAVGEDEMDTQPDLVVTGGTIKLALGIDEDAGITENTSYPAKSITPADVDGLQEEYYLIYLNDGDIYLIQFLRKGEGGMAWTKWPKKYIYWRAKEHP